MASNYLHRIEEKDGRLSSLLVVSFQVLQRLLFVNKAGKKVTKKMVRFVKDYQEDLKST